MAVSFSVRDLFGNAALTVSGHLRRGPDPACESALRAAFAELDAELAEILGDRCSSYGPTSQSYVTVVRN